MSEFASNGQSIACDIRTHTHFTGLLSKIVLNNLLSFHCQSIVFSDDLERVRDTIGKKTDTNADKNALFN